MVVIAYILSFAFMENVVLQYATGVRATVTFGANPDFRLEFLTALYLALCGILGWAVSLFWADFLGFEVLDIISFALLAVGLPVVLKKLFSGLIGESNWEQGTHYSFASAFVLAAALQSLHPGVAGALAGAVGAALGYSGLIRVYSSVMQRLDGEAVPSRLKGLPLSMIIIGLIGLACAGMDAVLTPAFWTIIRS